MTKKQKQIIAKSGYDASDFYQTSEGWSHNGFVAWQLETTTESKRDSESDDAKIAVVLRALDDAE